jgi:hypothetical protein
MDCGVLTYKSRLLASWALTLSVNGQGSFEKLNPCHQSVCDACARSRERVNNDGIDQETFQHSVLGKFESMCQSFGLIVCEAGGLWADFSVAGREIVLRICHYIA